MEVLGGNARHRLNIGQAIIDIRLDHACGAESGWGDSMNASVRPSPKENGGEDQGYIGDLRNISYGLS